MADRITETILKRLKKENQDINFRNVKETFESAIDRIFTRDDACNWMYMYSNDNGDYFKNRHTKQYMMNPK